MNENEKTTLVVRWKKSRDEETHVAAWKIAYADFVTAMMAFFLLLWLLNASMTVDLVMLGNSFVEDPDADTEELTATGSISGMGGVAVRDVDSEQENQIIVERIIVDQESSLKVALDAVQKDDKLTEHKFHNQAVVAQSEEEYATEDLENQLKEALRQIQSERPEEIVFDIHIFTDDAGLNLEFINDEGQRTFRWGSAEVTRPLYTTLFVVTRFLMRVDRPIMVTGHSAAAEGDMLSNWKLSLDRAESVRQVIARMGVGDPRLFGIGGKGSQQPLHRNDPNDMRNIRIQMTLLSNKDHQVIENFTRLNSPPPVASGG